MKILSFFLGITASQTYSQDITSISVIVWTTPVHPTHSPWSPWSSNSDSSRMEDHGTSRVPLPTSLPFVPGDDKASWTVGSIALERNGHFSVASTGRFHSLLCSVRRARVFLSKRTFILMTKRTSLHVCKHHHRSQYFPGLQPLIKVAKRVSHGRINE